MINPYSLIELPCMVYNTWEEETTGKHRIDCELIEIRRKIDPNAIESYSEAIPLDNFKSDNKIWTNVQTRSGDSFLVNMPFDEFEKLIVAKYE